MVLFCTPVRAPVFKSRLTLCVCSPSPCCWSRFPPEPALLRPGAVTWHMDRQGWLLSWLRRWCFLTETPGGWRVFLWHLPWEPPRSLKLLSPWLTHECLANILAPQDELCLDWNTAAHRPSLPLSSLLSFWKIISSVPGQCSGWLKIASCLLLCASPTPTASPPTPLKVEKEPL